MTDPGCAGLQIRVDTSGAKVWQFRFYWKRSRVKVTLGNWPEVTIARARELAHGAHQLLERGIDPRRGGLRRNRWRPVGSPATLDATAEEYTVAFLASEFMRFHIVPRRRRPEYVERILKREVLPYWADRDARTIKPREIIELLDRIVARGSPIAANRVASVLSQLFRFGVHRALVESSPVQLLYRPGGTERRRTRVLSERELAIFVEKREWACRYPRLAHVLTILLLTGQRRGELALARWSEIDFEAKTWRIPDENTKTDRGHTVPLSDWAVAEFRELSAMAGRSPYVLPSISGNEPLEPKLLTRSVARFVHRFKRVGIAAFTIHELRRTCRTGLAKLGVSGHIAKRVLNHRPEEMEGVYDLHEYLEEKRSALERWASYLAGLPE